jgi:hypothetical protein
MSALFFAVIQKYSINISYEKRKKSSQILLKIFIISQNICYDLFWEIGFLWK